MKNKLIALLLILLTVPVYSGDQEVVEDEDDIETYVVHGTRLAGYFGGFGGMAGRSFVLGLVPGGGGSSETNQTPETQDKESDPDQCEAANPILIATGNKYQTDADFIGTGENPLTVVRNYNNFSNHSGVFGDKWIGSFESKLEFIGSYPYHSIDKHGSQGEIIRYSTNPMDPPGYYFARLDDLVHRVVRQSDGTYVLSAGNGYTEKYNSSGKILEKRFAGGIKHTYSYSNGNISKITHSSGRYLTFGWVSGKLRTITDNAGNTYQYSYTGNYLSSAVRPGTPSLTRSYIYGDSRFSGALTQININGSKYATFTYDSSGRGSSSSHWASSSTEVEKHQFAYGSNLTTVTNPLGHSQRYRYQEINGVNKLIKVERLSAPDCPAANNNIGYDGKGMTDYTIDWKGVKTDYNYNSNGQLIYKTYAKGSAEEKTTYYTWNNGESYITKIETPDVRTEYEYDSSARLTKTVLTNISQFGVSGESRAITQSYTKHSNGVLSKVIIDGPRTDVNDITTYRYDTSGNLLSIENALGHTITYGNYNSLGYPGRATSANGLITDFTYDAQGKVLTKKVHHPSGYQTTKFQYNPLGLLTRVDFPDGNYLTNTYDNAYRLIKTTDRQGSYILYQRNANSDVISRKIMQEFTTVVMPPPDCGGFDPYMIQDNTISTDSKTFFDNCEPTVTTEFKPVKTNNYQYDVMGRLQVVLGAHGQKIDRDYDNNSNITEAADALGNTTTYTYDNLNRVKSVKDANNGITQYTYDGRGRVKTVTDARGLTTTYNYSGFGELVTLISPDTGTTTYDYNEAGQVIKTVRNNGAVSTFSYDVLGRITTEKHGAETKNYVYDLYANRVGRLYYVNDSSGQTVYWYDSVGNITRKRSKVDGIFYNTYYTYDGMNRLTSMTYPSGRKALYSYDSMGRVLQVRYQAGSTVKNVASNVKYRPFGPMSELTYGNGAIRQITHDLSYRPTKIFTTSIQSLSYNYDKRDNITKITNGIVSGATQTYGYDAVSRLQSVTGYKANTYTYDEVGNRKSQLISGSTESYSYSGSSNRLSSLYHNGEKTAYSYNSNGQTTQKGDSSFIYNSENRLIKHIGLFGRWAEYKYNALGQRVSKTKATSEVRYFYDESGRLTAEYLVAENKWKEYIYLHGQVVGFAVNGALYYVHNDHLGRAERITNASKSTVWRANNHDFDRVVAYGSADWYNLGFPGQYYDSEKDSYYNYFRDYDPKTGRYIQSDPIGLAGGINTYAYVGGNPINWFDPFGLSQCSCIEEQNRNSPDGDMWEKRRINENGQDEIYRFGRWNPVHDVNSMHGAIAQNSMDFATDFGWTTVGAWLQNIRKTSVVGTALSFNFSTLRTAARHYSSHMNSTYTSEETKIIEELNSNFAACARNAAGGIDE